MNKRHFFLIIIFFPRKLGFVDDLMSRVIYFYFFLFLLCSFTICLDILLICLLKECNMTILLEIVTILSIHIIGSCLYILLVIIQRKQECSWSSLFLCSPTIAL